MTTNRRFPRSVYDGGTEPDPRFSLANERTFLAWIRTALAFIGGGLAVEALQLPASPPLRLALAILLVVAGSASVWQAWFGWRATERALRHLTAMPSAGTKLPIAGLLTAAALLVIAGVLRP